MTEAEFKNSRVLTAALDTFLKSQTGEAVMGILTTYAEPSEEARLTSGSVDGAWHLCRGRLSSREKLRHLAVCSAAPEIDAVARRKATIDREMPAMPTTFTVKD
jgi:hypothetical protein